MKEQKRLRDYIDIKSGIYSITNTENKKVYVGESLNILKRWDAHKEELENGEHGNYLLQQDYNQFGPGCFEFKVEMLHINPRSIVSTKIDLLRFEHWYMKRYRQNKAVLYNLEDTIPKILTGKKQLINGISAENEWLIHNIINYKVVELDEYPVLIQRDTLPKIFREYAGYDPDSDVSRKLKTLISALKQSGIDIAEYIDKKRFCAITSGTNLEKEYAIETLTDEGKELLRQHILNNLDLCHKRITVKKRTKKQDAAQGNKNNHGFSNFLNDMQACGVLPDYSYEKVRNFLEKNGVIEVKKIGNSRRTFATEDSLINHVLEIKDAREVEGETVYTYVVTAYGTDYIKSIFEKVPAHNRNKIFAKHSS